MAERILAIPARAAFGQAAPIAGGDAYNSGYPIERSACLTIALGDRAAAECGNLRVTHTLPGVRIFNTDLAPTLIYNSEFAHPWPVFPVVIMQLATTTTPTSVEVKVSVGVYNNGPIVSHRVTQTWPGSEWPAGQTTMRRVTLTYDALQFGDTTGYYYYTMEVTNIYPGGVRMTAPTASGKMFLINRSSSPYGAGWWPAGLDKLMNLGTNEKVLIAGDGSARFFLQFSPTDTVFWAAYYDRADSLVYSPGTATYKHWLREGDRTEFNVLGQHVRTINRFGRTTTFAYTGSQLLTISLPAPTGMTYTFGYTGGKLSSVTAPPLGGTARVSQVTVSSGNLTQVRNPGDSLVLFNYKTTTPDLYLMDQRTNRRGVPTSFTYDVAKRVASSSVSPGSGAPTITWALTHGETRGLQGTPSVDTAKVYTRIDGPRPLPVADTTSVFSQRFGAPRRIVDPLAFVTGIRHFPECGGPDFDCGWPISRVQRPGGQVIQYVYQNPYLPGARGNITHVIDSTGTVAGVPDTTWFEWDPKFDQVTKVIPPQRDSSVFGVSTTNGRRDWQQDARGSTSRINYTYGNASYPEEVTTVALAPVGGQTANFSYNYDATLRNLNAETSPLGFVATHVADALGREIRVERMVDSTLSSTRRVHQRFGYNLLGRVVAETTHAVNPAPSPAETVYVRRYFNAEGQLDSLSRWSGPNSTAIGVLTNRWRYDLAGRQVASIDGALLKDSVVFDEAGNVTRTIGRRFAIGVPPVDMSYDVMNRLTQRIIPTVAYGVRNEGWQWTQNFISFGPHTVRPDTQVFGYSADGLMNKAYNRYAQVGRSFSANGRLLTDTLRIADIADTVLPKFTRHIYVNQYRYDRNGRRTVTKVPVGLVPAGKDSARITYASFGPVDHVYDLYGNDYLYTYNERGEPTQLNRVTAGITQNWTYDADGRVRSEVVNNSSTVFPRFVFPTLRNAGLVYDAGDRILKRSDPTASRDTLTSSYSVLGSLTSNRYVQYGNVQGFGTLQLISNETLNYDALGNITSGVVRDTLKDPPTVYNKSLIPRSVTYRAFTGRDTIDSQNGVGTRFMSYDFEGNNVFSTLQGFSSQFPAEDRAAYYDAAGKLAAADWRWQRNSQTTQGAEKFAFEEYRYDALGRRVWVGISRNCYAIYKDFWPEWEPNNLSIECLLSMFRRTVWDGDRELVEIQAPGNAPVAKQEQDVGAYRLTAPPQNPTQDRNPYYGQAVYTYGPGGLDRPLSITRLGYVDWPYGTADTTSWGPFTITPIWDTRGRPVLGVYGNGAAVKQLQFNALGCQPYASVYRCVKLYWPLNWSAYDQRRGVTTVSWFGTLLEDKKDYTGTYFRRNRAYDPASGRFTQEDPIGLAGGLNLYGFANGDPVNFSDPFGLCPGCGDPLKPRVHRPGVLGTLLGAIGTAASDYLGGVRERMTSPDALAELGMGIIMSIGSGGVGRSSLLRAEFESVVRPRYWMAQAMKNAGEHSAENLARMRAGKPPIGSDGFPMELHHRAPLGKGGTNDESNLQALTRTEHRLGENYMKNHPREEE